APDRLRAGAVPFGLATDLVVGQLVDGQVARLAGDFVDVAARRVHAGHLQVSDQVLAVVPLVELFLVLGRDVDPSDLQRRRRPVQPEPLVDLRREDLAVDPLGRLGACQGRRGLEAGQLTDLYKGGSTRNRYVPRRGQHPLTAGELALRRDLAPDDR